MQLEKKSSLIKQLAQQSGFQFCGIAKAVRLTDDARRLENWLQKGFHGNMDYMQRHFDLRIDPTQLVPGAKSVITLLLNYYPQQQQNPLAPQIAKYAYGTDYHFVIREKLNQLIATIKEQIGAINGRGFTDSAPVLERSWAQRSGLGWIGKNGNLITRQSGSFFFIATLITDLELQYDDNFAKDYCGTCTRCIDACPTQAILPNKEIDGSRCISYFTIELKDALIPQEQKGKFENWLFGCDTCQDVCPWNRFAQPTTEKQFNPLPGLLNLSTNDWEHMTEETFRTFFKSSPLQRTKFKGIQRNLKFLQP
ncbi:MAG: tRNA epoxyqueuosine(34) reductase QueG [Bacteroidota bacterium]